VAGWVHLGQRSSVDDGRAAVGRARQRSGPGQVGRVVLHGPGGGEGRRRAGPHQRPHGVVAAHQFGHEVPAQEAVGAADEDKRRHQR